MLQQSSLNVFYFSLTGAGGHPAPPEFVRGTISYAGDSASLIGSHIGISHIVDSFAASTRPELVCQECVLSFSTGPFVGTVPQSEHPARYTFSAGGFLQIIGGVTSTDGSVFLPVGTVLLTANPTEAFTVIESSPAPVLPEVVVEFQNALVHPQIRSAFEFPDGAFTGQSLIASADIHALNNPPHPFVLSGFSGTHNFEPSYVFVRNQ